MHDDEIKTLRMRHWKNNWSGRGHPRPFPHHFTITASLPLCSAPDTWSPWADRVKDVSKSLFSLRAFGCRQSSHFYFSSRLSYIPKARDKVAPIGWCRAPKYLCVAFICVARGFAWRYLLVFYLGSNTLCFSKELVLWLFPRLDEACLLCILLLSKKQLS